MATNLTDSDALERLKKTAEAAMHRTATEAVDEPEPAEPMAEIAVEPETVVAIESEPAEPMTEIAVEPMAAIAVDELADECTPRVVTCPQDAPNGIGETATKSKLSVPRAEQDRDAQDATSGLIPLLRRIALRASNRPSTPPLRHVPSVIAG